MRPTAVIAAAALLVLALAVDPAAAQSPDGLIAFENRYDDAAALDRVEVMDPDGSGRRVVVDDAASPALSPDGTHIAFQRGGDIWVADVASGQEVQVSAAPTFENNPSWSPDGGLLAYRRGFPPGSDCTHLQNAELIITDFSDELQLSNTPCLTEDAPDFSPDGGRLAFSMFYVNADFSGGVSFLGVTDLATGEFTDLTSPGEEYAQAPAWSPDGQRIAYNGLNNLSTIPATGGTSTAVLRFDELPEDCDSPSAPDWAPDGSRIAFGLSCEGGGVIAAVPAAGGVIQRLTGAGTDASSPSWAGTAQPPPPGPTPPGPNPPPPGGGSTPPQPDEPLITLIDDNRVDGGGSADPVGQTVLTSQQIWEDEGAGYVVLATADRFPDALAGSALAGESGPVLVTPTAADLDPRVAAEIDRVLGPAGFVLILGGTAAIPESAAVQAREAAGSASCAAPFPTDCRYAGTGREVTAALIGETVLALNGGSGGRVLLARGDAFADAITGGAYAAEAGVPILLTPPDQLNEATRAFVEANEVAEVIVLGGTAAVSQPVVDALPVAVTRRIAGGERTATAAAIAQELWAAEGLAGGGVVLVNVRDDQGWQTALAAAVVSALANAPQLGVENPPTGPSDPVLQAAAQLGGPVEAFGSAALVSDQQIQAVRDAAG